MGSSHSSQSRKNDEAPGLLSVSENNTTPFYSPIPVPEDSTRVIKDVGRINKNLKELFKKDLSWKFITVKEEHIYNGERFTKDSMKIQLQSRNNGEWESVKELSLSNFYRILGPLQMELTLANSALRPSSQMEDCPICMDSGVDTVLECSHAFCDQCIERWRVTSATCPLCRDSIEDRRDLWDLGTLSADEAMLEVKRLIAEMLSL